MLPPTEIYENFYYYLNAYNSWDFGIIYFEPKCKNRCSIYLYLPWKIFQYNSIDSPVATLWPHHLWPVSCLTGLLINTLTAGIVILTPLTVQTGELWLGGRPASQSITALLTTNDQFLLLSIIACIRLIARHDKMVRLSPFLDTQLVTGVLGCCTGVSREEMTYRLRTDSYEYDVKPQYFSDRNWLGFSFHLWPFGTTLANW